MRIIIPALKNLLVFIKKKRTQQRWIKKIDQFRNWPLSEKKPVIDKKSYITRWSPVSRNVRTEWYEFTSGVSGISDTDYVSEDLFYTVILPALNPPALAEAYSDKNIFEKILPELKDLFPETILRNINGIFYDSEYNLCNTPEETLLHAEDQDYLVKPSLESGSGKNIIFFKKSGENFTEYNGNKININLLLKSYKKNFLIQKKLNNSEFFKSLNHSSVNTVRFYTYRSYKNNQFDILNSLIRIGKPGSVIDNMNVGGRLLMLDNQGMTFNYTRDANGKKFLTNETGTLKYSDLKKVPDYSTLRGIALKVAESLPHFRNITVDMTIDSENKPRIIEINLRGMGIIFQTEGTSYFGKYTDDLIAFCSGEKKK